MTSDVETDVMAAVKRISAIPAILDVACQVTGMGCVAVARVTADRWIACSVLDHADFGLVEGSELPIAATRCNEVRGSQSEIVIDDVLNDPMSANHCMPSIEGLQSYIAVPVRLTDGSLFGTLCALDAKPSRLKDTPIVGMFRLFAQLIARDIDDHRTVNESQARLAESLETAELREQFIAILGHDLRNPLAAFEAGTQLLKNEPQTAKGEFIIEQLKATAHRMAALVNNMLDLARGQLAEGLTIHPDATQSLSATLGQVVAEMTAAHPDRVIHLSYCLTRPVAADHVRIGQLFSNLLGNATAHGSAEHPIRVHACIENDHLELSIANGGKAIPPEVLKRLFQPFYRGHHAQDAEGLGLGLYIASQIAQAHGGSLDVVSDENETKFTFRMPVVTSHMMALEPPFEAR